MQINPVWSFEDELSESLFETGVVPAIMKHVPEHPEDSTSCVLGGIREVFIDF